MGCLLQNDCQYMWRARGCNCLMLAASFNNSYIVLQNVPHILARAQTGGFLLARETRANWMTFSRKQTVIDNVLLFDNIQRPSQKSNPTETYDTF